MAQVINSNIQSLNSQRNLSSSQANLSTSLQRLSSGLRINSAKDDAAGLAISERFTSQIRGNQQAARNANDGISLAQTAEGGLSTAGDLLQRVRELAVQSANGSNSASDRASIQNEVSALSKELDRVATSTQFNGQNILATTNVSVFQVGANTSATLDQISVAAFDWTSAASITTAVGAAVGTDPTTALAGTDGSFALAAVAAIDSAINSINSQRATFGAVQNRFDNVVANLMVSTENQSAARSRIMDADYAAETANLSRAQILQQAGNAMVAQANQLPQQVLALLQR